MEYPSNQWVDYVLEICTGINHFVVNGVKVFIAMTDMDYPQDSHVHNDIEFMCVKRQKLTNILCENEILTLPQNHIMPFLPMQRHGCASPVTIHQYIAFAFPPEFYNKFLGSFGDFNLNFKNIPFPASSKFDYLVGYLFSEFCGNNNQAIMEKIVELIFLELTQSYLNNQNKNSVSESSLQKAKAFLDAHINLKYDLEETAKVAGMSKFYFCRKFKEEYKISPSNYLLFKKLEYSKFMMAMSDKNLSEISIELAFDSLSHFLTQFKNQYGISAGNYKKTLVK